MKPVVIGGAMLYCGDSLAVLPTLAEKSVDAICCDPPYELGFMGKSWDSSGIANNVNLWREALRVLKPGGHLLAFSGSRTYHRMTCAIEDAGFEVRDQIMWLYGSGFPKSHNGEWGGTALKPAHEPIVMARKPLDGTVAANWGLWGTGALNIDGCRVTTDENLNGGGYTPRADGNAWAETGGMNSAGACAATPFMQPLGRWPANIIHDGSNEVIAAFPDAKGQQGDLTGHSKDRLSKGIFGDMRAARDAIARVETETSAARFFYCTKASREDRNEGCAALPQKIGGMVSNTSGQHLTRRDEEYEAKPLGNFHPTVKPTDLMAYLCRLVTPPGGTVLDPFMGSGSTGKACMREGFKFIGIDMTPEYVVIARARIAYEIERVANAADEAQASAELAARQPDLFAPEPMKQEQTTMFAEAK